MTIRSATGDRSADPQYPFSGIGYNVGEDERRLLVLSVHPAPILVSGPVDGHVRAVQYDVDLVSGQVRGITFSKPINMSTPLTNRVILRAVCSTSEMAWPNAPRDMPILL